MGLLTRDKMMLITGTASLALGLAGGASAQDWVPAKPLAQKTTPYVAGDMHNHNTCTDGSVGASYAIDRSVGTGTYAPTAGSAILGGGKNFNLDWFTLGNHGGSGNHDCRFSDGAGFNIGQPQTTWNQTLGQAINADGVANGPNSITVSSLLGTQPSGAPTSSSVMWRWQNIRDFEYPILLERSKKYQKVLIEGVEWVVPGHEHTDVAVITGQFPSGVNAVGSAASMAEFEYRFDRGDNDVIGPVDASGNPIWTGKNFNNSGTLGHQKAVQGVTWLQANYPLTSYAVPTYSERAGAFNPNGSNGYNIEHFRDFNNAGPTVAFGIEAPGHFAQVTSGGSTYGSGAVGGGTYGLSGIYTSKVGGLWDGMLAEGRNFFIFISSDWHQRGTFGSRDPQSTADFFPGEYTKMYVQNKSALRAQNVIDGMRTGNSFSVNGDIIGPDFTFRASVNGVYKTMGRTLEFNPGDTITVEMRMVVPASDNSPYSFPNPILKTVGISQPLNKPSLDHVDLISSVITGVIPPSDPAYSQPANQGGVAGATLVYNSNAHVAQTFHAADMTVTPLANGSTRYEVTTTFTGGSQPFYIRARGTNVPVSTPNATDSAGNSLIDTMLTNIVCDDAACPTHLQTIAGTKRVSVGVAGWSNLWFYANPIFFRPAGSPKLLVETNAELAAQLASQQLASGH
ncbi:MAG: hypothetical protein ACJ8AW_11150 [Rhodopila sp.]